MANVDDVVRIWSSGGGAPAERLSRYAQALVAEGPVAAYHVLDDDEEDRAILSLYRVDRPRATIEDLHQVPPLALSGYHQMLHDLARAGLGPEPTGH
ncbi:hypothetical protein [Sinomonas halotolerans]|uniref:Uncharacterized protein n=1 Tax=Sinomonas halotolerans TaxID=1644133 RepID=A0ABU9X2A6_9MICC